MFYILEQNEREDMGTVNVFTPLKGVEVCDRSFHLIILIFEDKLSKVNKGL